MLHICIGIHLFFCIYIKMSPQYMHRFVKYWSMRTTWVRSVTVSASVQCRMSEHLKDTWWTAVCKITECCPLRGSSGDCLAQPPAQNRVKSKVRSGCSGQCPDEIWVSPRISWQSYLWAPVPVCDYSHSEFLLFLVSNRNFPCCNLNLLLLVWLCTSWKSLAPSSVCPLSR